MITRLLYEPLLYFLLAGAGLFVGHRWLQPEAGVSDDVHRIEVTRDDLRQMSVAWLAQGRPALTPEQMGHLVDAWVRDEILFREALALGLDKNDTIVKRRMVQKMDFLAEDLSALPEPTAAELEAWFAQHHDRFAEPARITFRHLYFSPDRRGGPAGAQAAASRAHDALTGKPGDAPEATTLGDPFMAQDRYPERAADDVARDFGPPFAGALFQLPAGSWQGPIESGFGWHVVFIDTLVPTRVPAFDEAFNQVRTAWVTEQREALKRKAFDEIRSRYEVVLPGDG